MLSGGSYNCYNDPNDPNWNHALGPAPQVLNPSLCWGPA
jgi:hypothetical protein